MNSWNRSLAVSAKPSNPLLVQHFQGCIDMHGQSIPHGFLFAPGPDECLICTCTNGIAGLCRTVLCGPPQNCRSLRVGNQCCQWICLDEIHPHGGNNFDVHNPNPEDSADVKLRLIASASTAIFSISLLLFLIYRLRKKKLRNRQRREQDDEMSVDSVRGMTGAYPMTDYSQNSPPRCHWYSFAWWKPHPNAFEGRPPPPSYDDAMMQRNTRDPDPRDIAGDGECSSMESVPSEAPPYSEIHLDPIIPDTSINWYSQQQTQQDSSTFVPTCTRANVQTSLSRTPSRRNAIPTGASLVLPVPPPGTSNLHHVENVPTHHHSFSTPNRNSLTNTLNVVAQNLNHVQPDDQQNHQNLRNDENTSASFSVVSHRPSRSEPYQNQSQERREEEQLNRVGGRTLPHSLQKMRARSREGIILLPEERDAVLHRFSLNLSLNMSGTSSSSSSSSLYSSPEERPRRSRSHHRKRSRSSEKGPNL